jgi:hypothetical protein
LQHHYFFALGLLDAKSSKTEEKGLYKIHDREDEPDYMVYLLAWLGQDRAGRSDQAILEPFLDPPDSKSTIIWPEKSDLERGTRHFMNFSTMVERRMHNRFIFKMDNGYMGVGPPRIEGGDVVVVLVGCKVPVLLRKAEDHYVLIGECFVQGLMDGEVIDELKSGKHIFGGFRIF